MEPCVDDAVGREGFFHSTTETHKPCCVLFSLDFVVLLVRGFCDIPAETGKPRATSQGPSLFLPLPEPPLSTQWADEGSRPFSASCLVLTPI